MSDNFLYKYFLTNTGKRIHKWLHYFDIYERHFARFRNQSPVIVEIGVFGGGSLSMWKEYFGEGSRIIGVDINPACKDYEDKDIEIFIGSQDDPSLIESIFSKYPNIDIVLDDGSHMMNHMIASFNLFYDRINQNGIYMVEDTHTCYWDDYNGGLKHPDSFIEFAKNKIDSLNATHTRGELPTSEFTQSTSSISYYDSIVVFEKKPQGYRQDLATGAMQGGGRFYSASSQRFSQSFKKQYLQLFFDIGNGFLEEDSKLISINPSTECQTISFDLKETKNIHSLRLDPLNAACVVKIENLVLQYPSHDIDALEYIKSNALSVHQNNYFFNTNDPILLLKHGDFKNLQELRVVIAYRYIGNNVINMCLEQVCSDKCAIEVELNDTLNKAIISQTQLESAQSELNNTKHQLEDTQTQLRKTQEELENTRIMNQKLTQKAQYFQDKLLDMAIQKENIRLYGSKRLINILSRD